MIRRCWFAGALVLLGGCGPRREPLSVHQAVPDFVLLAQNGQEFRSAESLKGRIWVADFIFTSCTGPCPRMSSQMRQLQENLKDLPDVRFVSFSVDPVNDTPEALAAYAKRFHADQSRWFFLTGAREALNALAREAFLLGAVDGSLNHSTRFVLVDREGRVRNYYGSSGPGVLGAIAGDIRLLAAGES